MRIPSFYWTKKTVCRCLAVTFAVCSVLQLGANPYENVDWDTFKQYTANLHTHTTVSDGLLTPQDVVDRYSALGYRVLSITDHDYVTFPWTMFSSIAPSEISYKKFKEGKLESLSIEHKDRDPVKLGMIAVQGAEPSSHHHIGSYFCNVPGKSSLTETLAEVKARDGIAVIFHPGRYDWPKDNYISLYKEWSELVGMEVYNQGNRFPDDMALWDEILSALMPERPIWGYCNDDMHKTEQLGRNRTIFILPELNEKEVRRAMEEGRFYFSRVETAADSAPTIRSIKVDGRRIMIHAENHDHIAWISNGREIHEGESIDMDKVKGLGSYVRAKLTGERGSTYTQPFSTGLKTPASADVKITSVD